MTSPVASQIFVIAGVNGAGKSSIGGATFRQLGADYYNPDEATRKFISADPTITQAEANSRAWQEGVLLLRRAIELRQDFVFETTLGGNTIRDLLKYAAAQGIEVHIWYVGLVTPDLHIRRVRARVSRGGHDIPEARIRERYVNSKRNLIELLPSVTALKVFDNSNEADPQLGIVPVPTLLLWIEHGRILYSVETKNSPSWAKAILRAARRIFER
jgi:predicted ABC-type ATPase